MTFALRVRVGGADERVQLGNETDGWDEARADQARKQLLAKIELGLWTPRASRGPGPFEQEPTFRELATDWLEARRRNPAIRPRTIELNELQLRRYLAPFFGELVPSQITKSKIKEYRQRIHIENEQIRAAQGAGKPLRDGRTGQRLRTLSNESINKTLQTLAAILDEAEDAGWISQNAARGRRTREPLERKRNTGALDVDELLDLLDAAGQLDAARHRHATLERAWVVRDLRDEQQLPWNEIAGRLDVAPATAVYLYRCVQEAVATSGTRRAIIATLAMAGPRVGELCLLDNIDIDLPKARFHIRDAKTDAGVRTVDVHPRLLDELTNYFAHRGTARGNAPAFPTRTGSRQDKDNVRRRVITPAVALANTRRAQRGIAPIRAHVTPHTFRRTYITYAIAAGFDIPYVQAQVGHADPSVTLAVYAQLMRRPDRDQLRAEIRSLLGVGTATIGDVGLAASRTEATQRAALATSRLAPVQKAPKGPRLGI